jgi:hypothetical protein
VGVGRRAPPRNWDWTPLNTDSPAYKQARPLISGARPLISGAVRRRNHAHGAGLLLWSGSKLLQLVELAFGQLFFLITLGLVPVYLSGPPLVV